jgi:hypothetical protein
MIVRLLIWTSLLLAYNVGVSQKCECDTLISVRYVEVGHTKLPCNIPYTERIMLVVDSSVVEVTFLDCKGAADIRIYDKKGELQIHGSYASGDSIREDVTYPLIDPTGEYKPSSYRYYKSKKTGVWYYP